MTHVSGDQEIAARAALEGRVAFTIATLAIVAGLIAVLDRVGLPDALVQSLGPLAIAVTLGTIGVLQRSMRSDRYVAADFSTPVPYLGFAGAALCAALLLPFLPFDDGGSVHPDIGFAASAAGGAALAVLVIAPLLRRSGAGSVAQFLSARFPSTSLRLGLAAVIIAAAVLAGLAGYELAISAATEAFGGSRAITAAAVAFLLVLGAAPGGWSGLTWTSNLATGVLVAALLIPLVILTLRGGAPLPLLSSPLSGSEAPASLSSDSGLANVGAGAGAAALILLLLRSGIAGNVSKAVQSGALTLLWTALAVVAVAASILWGASLAERAVSGQTPDRLSDTFLAAAMHGRADLCGEPVRDGPQVRAACRKLARQSVGRGDIQIRSPLFLPGVTSSTGAGAAGQGLLTGAALALGLTLAAAGFLCATTLGPDILRADTRFTNLRQLGTMRLFFLAVAAGGAVLTGTTRLNPALLISLAGCLGGATLLPLLALAVHPRVSGGAAVFALLLGLGAAEAVLFLHGPSPIALAQGAAVGAAAALLAGMLSTVLLPRRTSGGAI